MFIQQLANGLSVGSVYTPMAVGYTLIYSLMNFINFIHSITVMIGASTTLLFLTYAMQDLLAGIITGVIAAALLTTVVEFVAYRPLLKRNAGKVYLMIIGLGISVMGNNLIITAFFGGFRIFPMNLPSKNIRTMGANVGLVDMLILLVSMTSFLVVELTICKTKLGLTTGNAAFSLEATSLVGVDAFKLILSIFLITESLAGVTDTLLGAKRTAYPSLDTFYTSRALICTVFEGLGSLPGAVVGALVLGVSEVMVSAYVSTSLRDLFAYFLLIVILLTRPPGLMGGSSEDRA